MRKQSYDDYDDMPQAQKEPSESGPIPGYYDSNIIDSFCEDYTPGSYGNCDQIFTESQLRDIFNAHRDQDMTFTDPWIQYKTELRNRGFQFLPTPALGCSVMYVRIVEPELIVAM